MASYDLYYGDPQDERAKVEHLMNLFQNVRLRRAGFEPGWEDAAAICWPEYRNSFSFGHMRTPGAKMAEFQLDPSGAIASHRFMSIAEVMLTPSFMVWSKIEAGGKDRKYLMKQRGVKEYFADVTSILWEQRYRPEANFIGSNQRNMQSLGVFGSMYMMPDELDTRHNGLEPGIRYIAPSVGEIYLLENHQGMVDGFVRHFRWIGRQACQRWGDKCPRALKEANEKNSQDRFDFLQFVMPRTDYHPERILSPQGMPYMSCYVFANSPTLLEEGGYRTFPLAAGRYMQAPEEVEGRGAAQMVLGELKTLNAEKGLFLRAGHFAADPMWLMADDGLIDFKGHPGAHVFGGLGPDGQELVKAARGGDLQITEEMMKMSQIAVNDAFLVTLYPMLFDTQGRVRTAREVVEAASERAMFLSPLGRQHADYLGPLVYREMDILAWLGLFPDMPPVLREAGGNFMLRCAGPLARALQATGIGGYMRMSEMAGILAQQSGDSSILDHFEHDVALPEMAEMEFVPPQWMATTQRLAQKRKQRQAAAERERQVKELPGRAAIMKAQAISDKAQAGMHTGGVGSGTLAGGMPMMPGQTEPGGKPFP